MPLLIQCCYDAKLLPIIEKDLEVTQVQMLIFTITHPSPINSNPRVKAFQVEEIRV